MELFECIGSRTSKRDLEDKPVPKEIIDKILKLSLRAPSWANSQPWEIAVSTGKTSEFIKTNLYELAKNCTPINPDYPFPDSWPEKQNNNMFETGRHRFEYIGINRDDKEKRTEFSLRNYVFFHSQTAIFIYMDENLGLWSVFDCGFLAQNILLAAHDLGLGACPQAYLIAYPDVLRKAFKLPKNKKFLLGISLGYYKKASKVNEIKTFRNEDVINYFE